MLALVIAGGVLWSNVDQYHDVWLAPRGQLHELETIGHEFAGDGPALMTNYEPYGVRHFLRGLDPEGASELRRRFDYLVDGTTLDKGASADIDRVRDDQVPGLPHPRAAPRAGREQAAVGLPARLERPLVRGLAASGPSGQARSPRTCRSATRAKPRRCRPARA